MILVLIETAPAGATPLSLEAVHFARDVAAKIGSPVHALAIGGEVGDTVAQLAEQGVEVIHHATSEVLDDYAAAAWASALEDRVTLLQPQFVLAAASARGNEILAHLAARLDRPMATNCVTIEPGSEITATRQIWGGAALEELRLDGSPVLVTMASHAVAVEPAAVASSPEVVTFTPALRDSDLVARVVRVEAGEGGGSDLAAARVVVGGGRGVGGADSFDGLLELAALLGGTLGVSRVVTSQGWRPHHEQVGQTGTRIAPDLYVACGISGAIQHMAGCQSAKTILAINTDAGAPMVAKADYAIIGNLHEVVPAINAELRRRTTPYPHPPHPPFPPHGSLHAIRPRNGTSHGPAARGCAPSTNRHNNGTPVAQDPQAAGNPSWPAAE